MTLEELAVELKKISDFKYLICEKETSCRNQRTKYACMCSWIKEESWRFTR